MMARTPEAPAPEDVGGPAEGLNAKLDGLRVRTWIWIGVAIATVVLGFAAWDARARPRSRGHGGQGRMDPVCCSS